MGAENQEDEVSPITISRTSKPHPMPTVYDRHTSGKHFSYSLKEILLMLMKQNKFPKRSEIPNELKNLGTGTGTAVIWF